MRFVAGRGAVAAEMLLAGAPWLSAIGKLLLAWGAFADEMLLSRGAAELGAAEQDAAGREAARLHREDVAGREDARLHRETAAGSEGAKQHREALA